MEEQTLSAVQRRPTRELARRSESGSQRRPHRPDGHSPARFQPKRNQAASTNGSHESCNRTNNVANSAGATPFELTVRPKDRAWVSIKSDGKFVVRGIIKPPDVKTIRATSQVVFWTGNAGAVEVSFNGKSVPLTGGENEERVLVFIRVDCCHLRPPNDAAWQRTFNPTHQQEPW